MNAELASVERADHAQCAIPLSRLPSPSRLRLMTRLPDFVALMKPRVMALAVFTALVGLIVAPAHLNSLLWCVAILAIEAGAGATGVLNMCYDADIDGIMERTTMRPIPRREVSQGEALVFGLVLTVVAVAALGFALNVTSTALLAFTIFFYVVDYTAWLNRVTSQNIVIGGVADALPPVIGWAAATGRRIYTFGLVLAIILTVTSFWVANTTLLWSSGIPLGLAVLAIAQMGVHVVFFLHITTGRDSTNNVLALAFGVLIVILVVAGSLWIMASLNENMMPGPELMNLQMQP
jgi:cytochrome o ubiquinol oxidase subunit IV